MRTVTILEKCYGRCAHLGLEEISRHLKRLCQGLDVEISSVECNEKDWVKVVLAGEDEEVVVSYLEKGFGLTQSTIGNVPVGGNLRGKIVDSGSVGYGLYVDLGVVDPKNIDALIPLHELRTQLAGGRKTPLREIIHTFCLFDNLTLEVAPTKVDRERPLIEARLSNSQLSVFEDWGELNLERIVVIGATSRQVKNSVVRAGHKRDVLRIEDLGLLESSVICKLGTHARGLIPKLGRFLRGVSMYVFLPKAVRKLNGTDRVRIEDSGIGQ